ncbi:MAG TPA: hypothetical protein VF021_07260, partial [Longimicrobiales bacterium]
VEAQAPVRVEGFAFGAGVTTQQGVQPAAHLFAAGLLRAAGMPIEASVGASTADLESGQGTQRDVFVGALATQSVTRYFLIGGGVALHALSTRIAGADSDDALRAMERSRSGRRGALTALAALQLPLAARDAAALQLGARAAFMRGTRQLSFGLSVALRPGRGGLMRGERIAIPQARTEAARSWQSIVQQLMQLQGQLEPVSDVLVTNTALLIKFGPVADASLRDAVARIARILSAGSDAVMITVTGPQPARIAAAATAGGFPAERITLVQGGALVTLQAIRPPSARPPHSAQP